MSERVRAPHYTRGSIECIDYIADQGWMVGFCLGNIVKYATRMEHKGAMEADCRKIENYAVMLREWYETDRSRKARRMGMPAGSLGADLVDRECRAAEVLWCPSTGAEFGLEDEAPDEGVAEQLVDLTLGRGWFCHRCSFVHSADEAFCGICGGRSPLAQDKAVEP